MNNFLKRNVRLLTVLGTAWGLNLVLALFFYFHISDFPKDDSSSHALQISFIASYVEDILIFLTLTIAALILTARRPEDDKLKTKISYLFDGTNIWNDAIEYAEKQIRILSIYSPRTIYRLKIREVDEENDMILIEFELIVELQNMSSTESIRDDRVKLIIEPDKIDYLEQNDLPYGQIQSITSIQSDPYSPNNTKETELLNRPKFIYDQYYDEPTTLEFLPNSKITWNAEYYHWIKNNEEYNLKLYRVTKNFEIQIQNYTDHVISITNVAPADEQAPADEKTKVVRAFDRMSVIEGPVREPRKVYTLRISTN